MDAKKKNKLKNRLLDRFIKKLDVMDDGELIRMYEAVFEKRWDR